MKRLAVLLSVIALLAADAPLPRVIGEPDGDGSVLRIKNGHSQKLTAVLVEIVDYPGNQFRFLWDEAELEIIAPATEKRLRIESMMPGTVPEYLRVQAAIYADGATVGSKVNEILDARRSRLREVREQIRRAEAASPASESLKALRRLEAALAASKPSL